MNIFKVRRNQSPIRLAILEPLKYSDITEHPVMPVLRFCEIEYPIPFHSCRDHKEIMTFDWDEIS